MCWTPGPHPHSFTLTSLPYQVVKGFREGSYNILITTDIASRGLDIPECELSIQVTKLNIFLGSSCLPPSFH